MTRLSRRGYQVFWVAACLASTGGVANVANAEMASIPAGSYIPQYQAGAVSTPIAVTAFKLDVFPVSNGDYLHFVRARPEWRRDRVASIFAEPNYLAHWSDTDSLAPAMQQAPVVNVSWFAARAYCQWQGKRLPNLDEWEYVAAAADPTAPKEQSQVQRVLDWYSRPSSAAATVGSTYKNIFGVWDMHGLIWEWTEDFNNAMITGESRSDASVDKQLYCAAGSLSSADFKNYAAFMRYAFRGSLEARYTIKNLGFRCAQS